MFVWVSSKKLLLGILPLSGNQLHLGRPKKKIRQKFPELGFDQRPTTKSDGQSGNQLRQLQPQSKPTEKSRDIFPVAPASTRIGSTPDSQINQSAPHKVDEKKKLLSQPVSETFSIPPQSSHIPPLPLFAP
eukprot:Sdes_comp16462_c0_seq1m5791